MLLGLPIAEIKAIEAGYPTNIKWCCNQMLQRWLEMDITASWGKLFNVIDSPVVSAGFDKGIIFYEFSQYITKASYS